MSEVTAPLRPWIGRALPRAEDERFVKGEASYVGDLKLPEMLHAAFVRSLYAHGRITSVDTETACGLPGVRAILTAEDAYGLDEFPLGVRPGEEIVRVMHPVFARDCARYVGQPVALVVADTAEQAADAAEYVLVEVEELPALVEARAAE